jgi:outer membrane immunogenic protein
MKRHFLATTALALLPALALAADLPARVVKAPAMAPAAPLSWTGFYLGVQGGGAWSRASLSGAFDDGIGAVWSSKQSWSSGLIGGFAGYDYQFGLMVVGIEADVNARLGDHTGSLPGVNGIFVTTGWKSEADWDASVRARLGVLATPQLLLYATGGAAFSDYKFSNANATPANVYWGGTNIYGGSRVGWTAGAGAQYALTRNWNVRFDYRYTNYGTKSATGIFDVGKGPGTGSYRSKITDSRATGGIAYKF